MLRLNFNAVELDFNEPFIFEQWFAQRTSFHQVKNNHN